MTNELKLGKTTYAVDMILTPTQSDVEKLTTSQIVNIITDINFQGLLVNNFYIGIYLSILQNRNAKKEIYEYILSRLKKKKFSKKIITSPSDKDINNNLTIDLYNILLSGPINLDKDYYLKILKKLYERDFSIDNLKSIAINLR